MPHTPAGFMYGVFGTAPMIENILGKKAIPSGLDIYFFNLNGDPRNRRIYWHSSQANSAPSAVPSEDALLAGPHWMGHIRIADQEWGAIFVPSGKLVSGARNWQPEIALIIGLMMTGFVVTYLLISLRRTLRLELLTKSLQEATRELRREGEKVTHLARTDFLTGLANRTLFSDKISAAAARLRRDGETFTVLFLDLDGFKHINDSLGHPAGDELLREMARRLKSLLRETDVVARLGGDEFAIMRTGATNQREEAIDLARKVLSTVAKPFDFDGHNVTVKTSIGIALAPENGTEPGELMKKADLALYRVKSEGRNNFSFFDEEMNEDATTRHRLLNDLRMALSRNEFELHYQPVIDAKTSRPCGAEALVRWRHTVEGLIFPDRFIWLAEESGLMEQLGEWILKRACTDAASWPENIKVAVNLSAAQFQSDKLFDVILCALVESGLPPERLELEVTESILLQNKENYGAMIQQLKNIGISIVLDDFGTGYSSLSELTRFPFDKIKIDKSFTQGLSNRADCAAVVASVLTLARGLDIAVTAEGVETKQQFELLRAAGVNQLQGYLFGRPSPVAELDFSALERTGQAVEAAYLPVIQPTKFELAANTKMVRLLRARLHACGESGGAEGHEPDNPALGASSSQRQSPARPGGDVQSVYSRLDQLLRPILPHAVASDPDEDRCLCHSLGAPQIQAASPSTERRQRLVCPASPRHSNTLRSLAAMLWQRPNIGSRVNREVHARFWERAEVKFLRATRHHGG